MKKRFPYNRMRVLFDYNKGFVFPLKGEWTLSLCLGVTGFFCFVLNESLNYNNKIIEENTALIALVVPPNDTTITVPLYLTDPALSLDRIDPVASADTSTSAITMEYFSQDINNLNDQFNNISYSENNGTQDYTSNWQELGESDGPANGNAQIYDSDWCASGNCICIGAFGEDITNLGLFREANLAGATSATFNFSFRRIVEGTFNATVEAQVSADGGTSWSTLQTYDLNINDPSQVDQSFDITSYIASNTQIRFIASGNTSLFGDWIYFDNVEIVYESSTGPSTISFNQSNPLCTDLELTGNNPIEITTYVNVLEGNMSVNPNIVATLTYGSDTILTLVNSTFDVGANTLSWTEVLPADITIPTGQTIELEIFTDEPNVKFEIEYDSDTKPSKLDLPVSTFIEITSYAVYDATYPNGNIITSALPGATVYPRAIVTDPFGSGNISGLDFDILGNPSAADSVDSSSCVNIYEYEWVTPDSIGIYAIPATAKAGSENTVTTVEDLNFEICNQPVGSPVFVLGDSSSRCEGIESITYVATSNNAVTISYSLDSLSVLAGNTIDTASGEVLYVEDWSGQSIITVTATGCGDPISTTHTATIQTSVTTPVFDLGAASFRCGGAETITYSASASNTTGILYFLDGASVAAGNSITTSTGELTFVENWNGVSTIQVVALGCNGPALAEHTITTNSSVIAPTFDLGLTSFRCSEASNFYLASSPNASSISYSLDSLSLANGNAIDSLTGELTFNTEWLNSMQVTATAQGCNGPITSTHNILISVSCQPMANDDYLTVDQGEAGFVSTLDNDSDLNNDIDTSSFTIVQQPLNGQLTILNDGIVIYLANGTYTGQDTFEYQICDLAGNCDNASIYVTIEGALLDPCSEANRSHTFYLPFPEENLYSAFRGATSCPQSMGTTVRNIVSIKTPYPTIFIKYDHWEDGYEEDLNQPIQASTEIWGDGDLSNGVAPGYPDDYLVAGASVIVENTFDYVPPRDESIIVYDGRDKLVSSADISISKITGDESVFGFQSAKTSVYDINRYGTAFIVPFGEDLGTEFRYTALFVAVLEDSTSITVDVNGDDIIGPNDISTMLNQGEVLFVEGNPNAINQVNDIKSGAKVQSSKKVGLDILFGGLDCFGTRNINLLPASFYSNVYYTPVPTLVNSAPAKVYFYNSYETPITINWTSNSASGIINVPAESTTGFVLPNNFTAYKFENLGGEAFLAIEVIDADANGSAYDWAFNLIGVEQLTDFTSIAWAPGSSDFSRNDGPIWVTPTANTTLYVKNDGDISSNGPLISPCGQAYNYAVDINELDIYQVKDETDNDQSGTALFTCDSVAFIAVYGEDPSTALVGNPSMDVGTNMQPMCSEKLILANEDIRTTLPDTPIDIPVIDNDDSFLIDIDPNSLSIAGVLQPSNGSISINAQNRIVYVPDPGWIGHDYFEYRLCSVGNLVCDIATVTVIVTDCNATPITVVINGFTFLEQIPDNGTYDGEALHPNINVDLYLDANANGLIDFPTDTILASTTSNISGLYSFPRREIGNYIIKVGTTTAAYTPAILDTEVANFFAYGTCLNNAFLGVNATLSAVDDVSSGLLNTTQTFDVLANDIGFPDSTTLSTTGLIQAANGTVTINPNGTITYEPNYEFAGIDSFEYQICSIDDAAICDIATVVVSVDCPIVIGENIISGTVFLDANENGSFEIGEGGQESAKIRLFHDTNQNGLLENGDVLIDSVLTMSNGEYSFSPVLDSFPAYYVITIDRLSILGTYFTTDNLESASFNNISQTDCVNNFGILNCAGSCSPEANDDAVCIYAGDTVDIQVLSNDFDSDSDLDSTSVSIVNGGTPVANATISVDPITGTITYISSPLFNGIDSFEYMVCDLSTPFPYCDTATVQVELVSCNLEVDQVKILGQLFLDGNSNGLNDDTGNGIEGITIALFADNDCSGTINGADAIVSTTTTDAIGNYDFIEIVGTTNFPTCFIAQVDLASLPFGFLLTTNDFTPVSFGAPSNCLKNIDFGAKAFVIANDDVGSMLTYSGFVDINVADNDLGNQGLPTIVQQPASGTAVVNPDGTVRFIPDDDETAGMHFLTYQICSLDDPSACDIAQVVITIEGCDAGSVEKIIRGKVFRDINENGIHEIEAGVENINVRIYSDVNQNSLIDAGDILLSTEATNALGGYDYTFNSTFISATDDLSTGTYSGGTGPWITDWIEQDPYGSPGPNGNYVSISSGEISFYWAYTNSEVISRTVDLSGAVSATLSFDWRSVRLDAGESLSVQISTNGVNFTTIGSIVGWQTGTFTQNISSYISSTTTIRFVNDNQNWENNEYVFLDNFNIQAETDVSHFVIETETSSYPSGYYLTTDNIETAVIFTVGDCEADNLFGLNFMDNDGDEIPDVSDLDDDNDGIPDLVESDSDPLVDADSDGVASYLDDNDNNPGIGNDDGLVEATFDLDLDNIPNHFDLDSDNDACPDAFEAGHNQDIDADNRIVGPFGLNGLSATVENNDTPQASINYNPSESFPGTDDFLNENFNSICNVKPLAISDINATEKESPVSGNLLTNDQDADGNTLMVNTQALNIFGGNVMLSSNGNYTFTPAVGFSGEAGFSYEICDSGNPALCDTASVSIDVIDIFTPGLHQISGMEDHFITENDNTLSANLLANDKDPKANDLIINTTPLSFPTLGNLVINTNGEINYTPFLDVTGTDQFAYEVCDNTSSSICDTVIVTIEVLVGSNFNTIYATDDANLGNFGDTISGNVLLNDNSGSSGNVEVDTILLSAPQNGTLTLNNDGTYIYLPDSAFDGNDRFVYQVCDLASPFSCDSATVYLTVFDNRTLLDLKVMLQGALFNSPDSLMRSDLVNQGLVPLVQPYSIDVNPLYGNRFVHTIGGTEVTTNAVLNSNLGTPDAIVDWVFIELRNPIDSLTVVRTISALVQRDGDLVDAATGGKLYVTNLFGEFFVLVKHRNHLGAMTAAPISIVDKSLTVDFTTITGNNLYHNEMYDGLEQTLHLGKNALWAGNANADKKVKYDGPFNDRIVLNSEIITFPDNFDQILNYDNSIGYFQGDINMDGKLKYDGLLNDRILLQYILLTYNLNNAYLNNFNLMIEQIKYE